MIQSVERSATVSFTLFTYSLWPSHYYFGFWLANKVSCFYFQALIQGG